MPPSGTWRKSPALACTHVVPLNKFDGAFEDVKRTRRRSCGCAPGMKSHAIDTPSRLADLLVAMFPAFSEELRGGQLDSYHQVFQLLAPRALSYLQTSPEPTVKRFASLINTLVSNGGDLENAVSTCLFEHASQVRI